MLVKNRSRSPSRNLVASIEMREPLSFTPSRNLVAAAIGGGLVAYSDVRPFGGVYADAAQPTIKKKESGSFRNRARCSSCKNLDVGFKEAECFKIDTVNQKVHCKSSQKNNVGGNEEFTVDYDYLVIAMGGRANTFNTPGVVENAHFLKEVEDALRIRRSIIDSFEKASLPSGWNLQLYLIKLYPDLEKYMMITLLEAGDHILNMFDKRITDFAEEKFQRDGIEVKTGSMVVKVSDKSISLKERSSGETKNLPYGMVVWSTGIGTRPVIMDFMKEIGQEDISAIFSKAYKNKSGKLNVEDFTEVINDISERYPQVELHLKSKKLKNFVQLLHSNQDGAAKQASRLDIEKFKSALSEVDSKMKSLPPTAQVAAQQGEYLAKCFNRMKGCEENPEGPVRFGSTPVQALQVQAYASKLVSWRTRVISGTFEPKNSLISDRCSWPLPLTNYSLHLDGRPPETGRSSLYLVFCFSYSLILPFNYSLFLLLDLSSSGKRSSPILGGRLHFVKFELSKLMNVLNSSTQINYIEKVSIIGLWGRWN
ncbi:hypothetical protein L1987_16943 [Smallanthus sonchifolius]|uniref:Uncharacterized protein n=1 Tax=Smallanthus sonchifolius TaxID=185202 RepID=A0ACB9IXR0_9ASTR|nr:hypothetical protein L1987_16943 [Smallanthus sonchifolius]